MKSWIRICLLSICFSIMGSLGASLFAVERDCGIILINGGFSPAEKLEKIGYPQSGLKSVLSFLMASKLNGIQKSMVWKEAVYQMRRSEAGKDFVNYTFIFNVNDRPGTAFIGTQIAPMNRALLIIFDSGEVLLIENQTKIKGLAIKGLGFDRDNVSQLSKIDIWRMNRAINSAVKMHLEKYKTR